MPFTSIHYFATNQIFDEAGQGDTFTPPQDVFFQTVTPPTLTTTGYYFARPRINPVPGETTFSVTNTTPPYFVIPFGTPFSLTAWAKQTVNNGYSGIYAFPQQYFDKAYLADSNGNITTNLTGVLSEYGDYFPTDPGKVFLTTKPDAATGSVGTNIMNVIKLQLDVNHDGVMDLSFGGPDNTSPARPYVFWANNNFDRWDDDSYFLTPEQDDQQSAPGIYTIAPTPDCQYTDAYGDRLITCARDLEDFSRLWVCGVTTNLISSLPLGSTVTLSWGDVGNPNPSNPTIDLFLAADSDGGIGYLTNSAIASNQIDIVTGRFIGRLSPGTSIQIGANLSLSLPSILQHFIWCGVTNGNGALTLTIADGNSNVLVQTASYIKILDIKTMYERWTIGDEPAIPPVNVAYAVAEGLTAGQLPFQYAPPTVSNTPYILHVHGYNMKPWEKDRYAETEYKRLYWQGYQGRFGAFNWPTAQNFAEFGASESQAWDSAEGLLNKLNDLNSEYPGHVYLTVHSLGNVVAGEALLLAGTNQVVNTYVAMQGAVTANAYDSTVATHPLSHDSGTPDCYAHYWTNGAPCYFNGSAGAGTYVNFFNTNDWALNKWLDFESLKPILFPNYIFDAPSSYYTNSGGGENPTLTPLFFPTSRYQLFTCLIQARSFALGAQTNVGGVFLSGTNFHQVELDLPPYNFGTQHIYHSGEFRSDYTQRWQYWNQVLIRMGLKSTQ